MTSSSLRAVLWVLLLGGAGEVAGQGPGFTDVTTAAGVTFVFNPIVPTNGLTNHGGGTEGDFNNDGWPDLFVVGGGLTRDRLFINNQNGTFTDMAVAAGITLLYRGNGATAADYDDDGDMDIYVTNFGNAGASQQPGQHKLWRNDGNGSFTDVAVAAGVNSTGSLPDGNGATFGDYDLDGDLDLVVSCSQPRVFRNQLAETGTATFVDVSVAAGISTTAVRNFGGLLADMDGDRYPELMLASDFGTSEYYVNDGDGTFTLHWPTVPGDTKVHNGMGECVGDFNRDGLLDWFVTAIYPAWQNEGPPGNRLYVNVGGGQFQSLPDSAGVNDGGWGWGTATIDFDHDGWQDLVMTNGWPECPDPVTGECFTNEPSYLFRNNGDLTFSEVHEANDLMNFYEGRGLITFDYDRDGDMDVVILSNNFAGPGDSPLTGNLQLCRNEACGPGGPQAGRNYLVVVLDTTAVPGLAPHGFGANVRVTTGAEVQHVRINGGCNYLSRSQLVAHFGLGSHAAVDELRVDWPDGSFTRLTNVAANQTMTVAAQPSAWKSLGFAKAGVANLPHLSASGPLSANSLNQLELESAAPSSSATLIFGLAAINLPFKGGTLVPAPAILVTLPTSAAGATALPFLFPGGVPAGIGLVFQFWIVDPVASHGLSASNGLKGTTQ